VCLQFWPHEIYRDFYERLASFRNRNGKRWERRLNDAYPAEVARGDLTGTASLGMEGRMSDTGRDGAAFRDNSRLYLSPLSFIQPLCVTREINDGVLLRASRRVSAHGWLSGTLAEVKSPGTPASAGRGRRTASSFQSDNRIGEPEVSSVAGWPSVQRR